MLKIIFTIVVVSEVINVILNVAIRRIEKDKDTIISDFVKDLRKQYEKDDC